MILACWRVCLSNMHFQPLCIYGNPAYPLRQHLESQFRKARPTQQMRDSNKSMSAMGIPVEWAFGEVAHINLSI